MDLPQYALLNNTLPCMRMPGACSILVDRCKSHELVLFPVETLLIMFTIRYLYKGGHRVRRCHLSAPVEVEVLRLGFHGYYKDLSLFQAT